MSRNNGLSAIVSGLAAHPYLCTLGLCLFFEPLVILGAEQNFQDYTLWLETFVIIGVTAFCWLYTLRSRKLTHCSAFTFGISVTLATCFVIRLFVQSASKNQEFAGIWAVTIILAFTLISFFLLRKLDNFEYDSVQLNCMLIIGLSFFLKLFYIIVTSVYTRQHDVGEFGDNALHTGYIEYLLKNHQIPDFDVRNHWQFYHPPLHHAISAVWIYINESVMSLGFNAARESLQVLTLFYSMCVTISAYRILRFFRLKGWALYIPVTIVSFHPTFILLSGSINNDILATVFIIGAILTTLEWYRERTMTRILKIALCVGLGMMTKISAAIVAPPIALVFLYVFLKNRKRDKSVRTPGHSLICYEPNRPQILFQFVCFGVVCIPLGLWFAIRNYLNWGVPFTYVPMMDTNSAQYVGRFSYLFRLTDLSTEQFGSPYVHLNVPYSQGYTEYNPTIALLKSSLFGEWEIIDTNNTWLGVLSNVAPAMLFWINICIVFFSLVAIVYICIKETDPMRRAGIYFITAWYTITMVSFYKMAEDYPFTSTMDFRYISPTVIVGATFIGLFLNRAIRNSSATTNRITTYFIGAATFVFAATSSLIYLSVL